MVELFLKFSQFLFHGRVISEILPIVEIHGNVEGGVNFNTVVQYSPTKKTDHNGG